MTFLVGMAPLVAVATVLIEQWMMVHRHEENWLPYWITAVASCTCAWLIGYWTPLHARRKAGHSVRLRVISLCLVAVIGCLTTFLGILVAILVGIDVRSFQGVAETVILCATIIGAGTVAGGMWRGWPMLNGRERMHSLLATQWLLWPVILPDLVYLAATFFGLPKDAADHLLADRHGILLGTKYADLLVIAASLVGALSIVRIWSFGLTSAAVGLLLYWSAVAAMVYTHVAVRILTSPSRL